MAFYDSRRLALEGPIPSSITNLYQVQTSTLAEGGNLPSLLKEEKNGFYMWPTCFAWNKFDTSSVNNRLRLQSEEMLTWMIGIWVVSGIQTGFGYCGLTQLIIAWLSMYSLN